MICLICASNMLFGLKIRHPGVAVCATVDSDEKQACTSAQRVGFVLFSHQERSFGGVGPSLCS